jgi:hypothetical protein
MLHLYIGHDFYNFLKNEIQFLYISSGSASPLPIKIVGAHLVAGVWAKN